MLSRACCLLGSQWIPGSNYPSGGLCPLLKAAWDLQECLDQLPFLTDEQSHPQRSWEDCPRGNGQKWGDRIDVLISSPCSFHSTVFSKAWGGPECRKGDNSVWGLLECRVSCRLLPALPDASCMEATWLSERRAAQCGHSPIPVSPWRPRGLSSSSSQTSRIYNDFLHLGNSHVEQYSFLGSLI